MSSAAVEQVDRRRYIRHPSSLPVRYRRIESGGDRASDMRDVSLGGICFRAGERLDEGDLIELTIPDVAESARFTGRIQWCHAQGPDYEVGMSFTGRQDLYRARMIEQICQIEVYRREREAATGRPVDSETAAREWIARFASSFPG